MNNDLLNVRVLTLATNFENEMIGTNLFGSYIENVV
jgi:hypothetical protein